MQVWQAEQNNRIPSIRPLTAPCAHSQRSFLPQIKNESTTHDEEENAAGRQARRRRKTAQTAWVEAFTKICYNFFEEILKIVKPNPIFVGIYSEGT